MRIQASLISSAAMAAVLALAGCNTSLSGSPAYLTTAITPRPATVAVGSTTVFTGIASNNLSVPQWSILDSSLSGNPGTLTAVPGSPNQISYMAPATPPVYAQTPTGITQGTVTLVAAVTDPPGTSTPTTNDSVSFVVTAPSVTLGLAPTTASVPLGGTFQFIGYAVGNVDNALIWTLKDQNGGTGGVGTVNTGGTYVAPASLPMAGSMVILTITSHADPTKTITATITLH